MIPTLSRGIVALAWGALLVAAGCAPAPPPPTVVLVISDTTRVDHLSAYGYPRDTTPQLKRLAAEGQRYVEAFAQSSWTLPTVVTLLTGEPPYRHGSRRLESGAVAPVNADVPTLAERLQSAGWSTGAFINVVWLHPGSGVSRGFDTYDFQSTDSSNRGARDAAATTDAALGWLRGQDDRPAFAVVHYFDPHLTYDPPAPYDTLFLPDDAGELPRDFGSAQEMFAVRSGEIRLSEAERKTLIARYDGEIRHVDDQFGRLRAGLEELGRWDDALVVFVGDHGEEFWDHGGFEHGHSHFDELIRLPLIVKDPSQPAGRIVADRVRQLDVAPTVLRHAGLDAASLPGRPLGEGGAEHSIAEGSLWSGDLLSIRTDLGAVIYVRDTGVKGFFPAGEGQRRALPITDPGAREMLSILEALPTPAESGRPDWEPDEEQLERLRSLGYVR